MIICMKSFIIVISIIATIIIVGPKRDIGLEFLARGGSVHTITFKKLLVPTSE